MPPSADDDVSAGSILRELILNQYQAIVLGGAALASLVTLNPLPMLVWLGSELVLLPILDSGPLRRLVARRRRALARERARAERQGLVARLNREHRGRYVELDALCRQIEANYQGLSGISQVYLAEQRGKLDLILQGCLHRMLALQRYESMPSRRDPDAIREDIRDIEEEIARPDLPERALGALRKNLELKQKLLASTLDVADAIRTFEAEIDSLAALLEVLHQNSVALRDPQAISDELDAIVRQSEDSEKVVREMETLLRADTAWAAPVALPDVPADREGAGDRGRARERRRRSRER